MKTIFTTLSAILFCFISCTKSPLLSPVVTPHINVPKASSFVKYTIESGEHYCNNNTFTKTEYEVQRFSVRFDSSAVYQTLSQTNQYDINKLFGFSDNNEHHHQNSARFGWRWSDNSLRLFAYVYNHGERSSVEITRVIPGLKYACAIRVTNDSYIFSVENDSVSMPRESSIPRAIGYKLYPYFGGDEAAPHTIQIWIEERIDHK